MKDDEGERQTALHDRFASLKKLLSDPVDPANPVILSRFSQYAREAGQDNWIDWIYRMKNR
jgi:hypothetical protein